MPEPTRRTITRSLAIALAGFMLAGASRAEAQTAITVHAPASGAKTAPPLLGGMNLTSYAHTSSFAACCMEYAGALNFSGWRVPGGTLSLYWHWLDGVYNCNWVAVSGGQICADPGGVNGISFDGYVTAANALGVAPIVTINWEASEQETLNLVEYANVAVPPAPDPAWTPTSYALDQKAPAGYFAWLRSKRLQAAPVGVKYWELGNEIFGSWENDQITHNDGTQYGTRAAQFIKDIHALDPASKVGVVDWWPGWDTPMLSALKTAGQKPDFLIEHAYAGCNSASGSISDAQNLMNDPNNRAGDASGMRGEVDSTWPGYGSQVELFFTEFGPDGCNPTDWMVDNIWSAIYMVRQYGEGLLAGYSNMDYWNYTQGSSPYSAIVEASAPFASTYFGAWLWGQFAQGGGSVLQVDGASGNLSAYAMYGRDGSTRVLLVNRDTAASANLAVSLVGVSASSVTSYLYDQTLGGYNSTSRKTMAQAPTKGTVAVTGGAASVMMSPLSIVLLLSPATGKPAPDGGVMAGDRSPGGSDATATGGDVGSPAGDGGVAGDRGAGSPPGMRGGCSCQLAANPDVPGPAATTLLLLALALLALRGGRARSSRGRDGAP